MTSRYFCPATVLDSATGPLPRVRYVWSVGTGHYQRTYVWSVGIGHYYRTYVLIFIQDPVGKWTTRRPPDDRKETQTRVVWSCFPFIRTGQNHLAKHSERGKKTRRTKEEVGRQYQGMDRPGVRKSQGAVENRGKWRKLVAKSSVVPQRPSRLRD